MDIWTTNTLSLGGLTVGLGILTWHGYRWWFTQKGNWKALLLPFLPLLSYGMLLILSAGGILGGAAGVTLWGENLIGDLTLEYGVGGGTTNVTRSVSLVLTNGGHMMVVLITIALAAMWVFKKSMRHRDILIPIVGGISLGLSSGIAGVAAMGLGPLVDTAGGMLAGVL
jgi:hypothetical protein